MRLMSLLGLVIPVLLSTQHTHAQIKNAKTATVKIFGNTPAVKTIIEKEGRDGQFAKVDWNQATKLAVVTYDSSKTSADEVLKRIALAGFDNEKFLAPDDAYVQLAKAEQYERVLKPALKNDTEQQVDHTNHRQGVQTTIQPSVNSKAADEKTAFALLASSYFALKDALVKTDAVAAAAHAEAFQAAVKAVDMNKLGHDEHTVWMKVMNKLASDATGITKNKDVAKQRVAFASLSTTLYELLKVSKLDGPIYYQHCPMFSEGKGAHWLSKENAVKNPFFGAQMISCGSTVETLN
ncbi:MULTISPECIES: DUF3347 domain-containing protein [Sphingobacterium]|uniref:DUF3347 domain-containing protein n=1 Tax=Sphingobacterium TaxID=28453 RepID=UPI00257C8834|nr:MULTISPECIES: DUF3347 domain-containing protein [Sphingobacterium]